MAAAGSAPPSLTGMMGRRAPNPTFVSARSLVSGRTTQATLPRLVSNGRFVPGPLSPGAPVAIAAAGEMRDAQLAVEAAEAQLWSVRQELLGWTRPPWAPSATLAADWFSDEDTVYDDDDNAK